MPQLEAKQIQQELKNNQIWPVYWIYGKESMKVRELVKRIRTTVTGSESTQSNALGNSILDGSQVSAAEVMDSANSLSLGGGINFVTVQNAHDLKDLELIEPLFEDKQKKDQIQSVCIFISKDLDKRKKISKTLIKKTAVIACEEIPDEQKEDWIHYLAKKNKMELQPKTVALLRSLDPWSLDIIHQELEKISLAGTEDIVQGQIEGVSTDQFIQAFFTKNKKVTLQAIDQFANSPEVSIPLLGLLAWNVRHLALLLADQKAGTRSVKLNPYLADRFRRWTSFWTLDEISRVQKILGKIDFGTKQTRLLPVGLWSQLGHELN